uniref:Uncharacterized protein n=1 Tax=Calidris pygmaea TaxID=425635 RepID=A0A8C3PTG5_9CHAR
MSSANLTSSSSWYSVSCCCIWSLISVISLSFASSIFLNFSRSPAIISSNSRIFPSIKFRKYEGTEMLIYKKHTVFPLPVSEGQKAGTLPGGQLGCARGLPPGAGTRREIRDSLLETKRSFLAQGREIPHPQQILGK